MQHIYFCVDFNHNTNNYLNIGFEIKVTEAIVKGKPVIAYASGGIPLQIWHGVTGYLVETGNIDVATDYMYKMFKDRELRERMVDSCKRFRCDEYFTVRSTGSSAYEPVECS